ncbi:hypothetical protein PIB30_066816 [Stylosanthes scabra]|uniref:NB-ARC domain-containing protein n=1 Tax=Stylosanthes scabra TaxID=79078 RepID=A0ABU6TM56_9FABA|nr:hypothetical protein [Stylosanthes scabra]
MILVTTRDDRVANALESKNPHLTVSLMNEEESWELFHNEVFYSTICTPELEAIGRSIAKTCNGLPLVIKTTAGIVAKRKKLKEEWEKSKNELHCWSIAEVKDGRKNMVEVLKPSYDDLYEEMKPCFLYLGAFPEDEEILVRDLICMWIAEEFIEKPEIHAGGKSKEAAPPPMEPEDIGERYLKELVDRNLVQVASRRSDDKGVKTVKIHDLIRELCISESNKSNKGCSLSFPKNIGSYACLVEPRDQSSTRSLFVHGGVKGCSHLIPEDCQVNVLYLGEFRYGGLVNDDDLKMLKSIRFLKGQCAGLYGLFKVQGLQTLHVLSTFHWKKDKISIDEGLKQLRHIVCHSRMHLLVDAEEVKDKMQNLQTLLYVYADSQLGFLLDNGYFANLRTLGLLISNSQVRLVEENLRSLDRLSKLRKLEIDFETYERVSLGKIAFPSNLTKITLVYFRGLKYEDMNALGRIPRLQILKLFGVDCSEKILHCGSAGSFPQLEVFIMEFVKVERIILEDGAMPKLRRAVFHKCPGLKFNCLPEQMRCLGSNLLFVEHVPFGEELE